MEESGVHLQEAGGCEEEGLGAMSGSPVQAGANPSAGVGQQQLSLVEASENPFGLDAPVQAGEEMEVAHQPQSDAICPNKTSGAFCGIFRCGSPVQAGEAVEAAPVPVSVARASSDEVFPSDSLLGPPVLAGEAVSPSVSLHGIARHSLESFGSPSTVAREVDTSPQDSRSQFGLKDAVEMVQDLLVQHEHPPKVKLGVVPGATAGGIPVRAATQTAAAGGSQGTPVHSPSGVGTARGLEFHGTNLLTLLQVDRVSQHSTQQLCSSAQSLPKHVLQLGFTLLQLLLCSPRDGHWIRHFLQVTDGKNALTPCQRDVLPLLDLPPLGAVVEGLKLFPHNGLGLVVVTRPNGWGKQRQRWNKLASACAMQVWRLLSMLVLNGEYCDWQVKFIPVRRALNASQRNTLHNITTMCTQFVASALEPLGCADFSKILRSKTIDYSGDEVSYALPLKVDELLPGLPDAGTAGSLDALGYASEEVAAWLGNPSVTLKPREEWPVRVPRARINAARSEWNALCSILVARDILAPIPFKDIFAVEGVPVLNGAFAVEKKGRPGPNASRVTRLIMNMVPGNSYQILQRGDLPTLSASPNWAAIVMGTHQALLWSSEDQKGAFYAWKLPASWRPFMAFAWPVPGALVGLPGESLVYLASNVIPMGWLQAVSLFQHLHRQLGIEAGHEAQSEWRRDLPSPIRPGFLTSHWVQFYLDDFDCPEFVPLECWQAYKGILSPHHQRQRQAYEQAGVATSEDKQQVRQPLVVRMGAEVDGILGTIRPPASKMLEVAWFGLWLLRKQCPNRKALLMVLGRYIRCFEFRRPLMSLLEDCWPKANQPTFAPLSKLCVQSILRAAASLAMCSTNLRAAVDGRVSCSDASEQGGGLCVSAGLTSTGDELLASLQQPAYVHTRISPFSSAGAMPVPNPCGPRVFVISLFDGISALMVGLSRLPCQIVAFASSEIDADCKRLVRRRWPGVMELGSILTIDHKTVDFLYLCVGNLCDLVLVAGGSPCQDLSVLLAGGKGLQGDRSGLFFEIPRIVKLLRSRFTCPVELLVENVFSMTPANRQEFSRVLQCKPYLVDARFFSWCRRPRLFWVTWNIAPQFNEELIDHGDYWEWTFPVVRGPAESWVDPGSSFAGKGLLPTLTRALPRATPPRNPAGLATASAEAVARWRQDRHRFQVYHYETCHLVTGPSGLRLPSLTEREVLMGFPRGYISRALPPKMLEEQAFNTGCCMIGNTFNVHVIVMVCHALLKAHCSATLPRDHVALCAAPMEAPPRWTSYPSFVSHDATDTRCEHLVQEYLRLGDRGGTDIKLDLGIPFRCKAYPRAGLQSHYFHWKIVQGWPWKHSAHINCLELQAVVNSIQWRLRRSGSHRRRVLHLVDSQVVAAIIAKGRTSSFRLRRGLKRLNSLLVASGVTLCVGYVHTSDNPSDIPSRWASKSAGKLVRRIVKGSRSKAA